MLDYLRKRLKDHEDNFTERKGSRPKDSELRRTLVAFANSVPEGHKALLFIGVSDDGAVVGIRDPDSDQKRIRKIAQEDCYPPVQFQSQVFEYEDNTMIAVIIEASNQRPHFSGPAFVRIGSESIAASAKIYEDLIASRHTKAGTILRHKDELISFNQIYHDQFSRERIRYTIECRIEGCSAHVVDLCDTGSDRHFSIPLEKIRISNDSKKRRMLLEAIG